jgi:hypothetical protein
MDPEDWLPHSQEPLPPTRPYPEPHKYSPYYSSLSLSKICCNIIHPPKILVHSFEYTYFYKPCELCRISVVTNIIID